MELKNTIEQDCKYWEELNGNGFCNYMHLQECENSSESGLYQLILNGVERRYELMQTEQELQNLLYEKMSKEQDNYIEKLKHSKPEEIISSAYEKVMRDDILMLFDGDDTFLDKKQLKELLKLEYPLSACYDAWMDTDISYMDMLRDTVDDFAKDLVNETEQAKKKKRQEPER